MQGMMTELLINYIQVVNIQHRSYIFPYNTTKKVSAKKTNHPYPHGSS